MELRLGPTILEMIPPSENTPPSQKGIVKIDGTIHRTVALGDARRSLSLAVAVLLPGTSGVRPPGYP